MNGPRITRIDTDKMKGEKTNGAGFTGGGWYCWCNWFGCLAGGAGDTGFAGSAGGSGGAGSAGFDGGHSIGYTVKLLQA